MNDTSLFLPPLGGEVNAEGRASHGSSTTSGADGGR